MFAIYLPGPGPTTDAALASVGADWALDPSVQPMFGHFDEGPDGGSGRVVYFQQRGRLSPAHLVAYDAASQDWLPAAPDDSLEAGRFWLGVWKQDRPTSADLQRSTVVDGLPVELCDGCDWVIPIADYLPKRLTLNRETGEQQTQVAECYRRFTERSNELFRWLVSDEFQGELQENLRVVIPKGLRYAADALAINYRVNQDLVDMLGLIGEFEAVKIACVATAAEVITETADYKKKLALLAMKSCDA